MDNNQISYAPVAKRRRLADEYDEAQVPKPDCIPKYSSCASANGEPAFFTVTQWPCHSALGHRWDSNAATVVEPSLNINNLATGQCGSLQSFRNGQRTPTQDISGMGSNWGNLYHGPDPQSNFHVDIPGQHPNSSYGTFSPSQQGIPQPSYAMLNTFWGEKDPSNPYNFQHTFSVQHPVSCPIGPSIAEDLRQSFDCPEFAEVADVGEPRCEPQETEIVCFGMVREFPERLVFRKLTCHS